MTVKVVHEPGHKYGLKENCCLCRKPTAFWHRKNDVALCPACAMTADPAQIPTKPEWIAAERARNPRWY